MLRSILAALLIAVPVAAQAQPTATMTLNADQGRDTISRHIYGHFAERLGRCIYGGIWVGEAPDVPNVDGIRLDVVEALRALSIPNLRWPGGWQSSRIAAVARAVGIGSSRTVTKPSPGSGPRRS